MCIPRDAHAEPFQFVDVDGKGARGRIQQGTAAERTALRYTSPAILARFNRARDFRGTFAGLGTQARRHQRKATSRREALFDIPCRGASHRQTCPRAPLGSTFIANLSDPIQSSLRTRMSRSPGRPRQPQQREPPVQVFVRDNNIDQALRVLKKRMQREGVFREMRRARFYEKPSEAGHSRRIDRGQAEEARCRRREASHAGGGCNGTNDLRDRVARGRTAPLPRRARPG